MSASFQWITMRRPACDGLSGWVLCLAFAMLLSPRPAVARQAVARPAPTRQTAPQLEIAVNFGQSAASKDFTRTSVLRLNAEDGELSAGYGIGTSPLLDLGAGVRVARRVWISGAFSRFTDSGDSEISARLPHPFFFGQFREVSGVANPDRTEAGIHVQVQAAIPVGDRIVVKIGAGPTIAMLDQEIVTKVEYSESYPFDSAIFTGATPELQSNWAIGFNAGADVTIKASSHVGVGALVRFSRATVTLEPATGGSLSVQSGGLQVGGGLRISF